MRDPQVAAPDNNGEQLRRLYVEQGLSISKIAGRLDRSAWWVRQRLLEVGVRIRPRGGTRGPPPDQQLVRQLSELYIDREFTTPQIAQQLGRSPGWVQAKLNAAGISLRPSGGRRKLDDTEITRLYSIEMLNEVQIAKRLGVSAGGVHRSLVRSQTPRRSHGHRLPISADELRRLYLDEQLSTIAIAERLGMSSSGINSALHRIGVEPRRGTELEIVDEELQGLYVDEGLDDNEIARRYDVAPWAVRRRIRAASIRRPAAKPDYARPSPPDDELGSLYHDAGLTQAEIATHYRVPRPTVRRWLDNAGIDRRQVADGLGQRPSVGIELTAEVLFDLYVDKEWTAAAIGQHLGVSKRLVLSALHAHGVPVRPAGARRPATAPPLLDQLYGDPRIAAALRQHQVPRRPKPGSLRDRWPSPATLTRSLLSQLYNDIGLSAAHISLLSGHTEPALFTAMQQHGIATRPAHERSPWAAHYRRH